MLRTTIVLNVALMFSVAAASQQPPASTPIAPTQGQRDSDLAAYTRLLTVLNQNAQRTALDLAKLRIDKWKTDGDTKQQAQANNDSLQRNLTAALPDLIAKAQAAPQDFGPNFRLYRNLNALYDVLFSVAETAGAFGPKDQYEPLAQDAAAIDQTRRNLADRLDWLAGVRDADFARIQQALLAARQQSSPSKVVVDNDAKTTKPAKKKPSAATPAATH